MAHEEEAPAVYSDNNATKECPVCIDEIHPVSECRLRCGHSLCSQCITQLRRGVCPVCRTAIFPDDAAPAHVAVGGGGHAPSDLRGSSHRHLRPQHPPARNPTVRMRPERTNPFGHPGGVGGSMQAAGGHMHFSAF